MRRCPFIISCAALLIFATGAFADSMTFTNPGTNVWAGVYVNPYTGVDNTLHSPSLTLFCDDWNTDFYGNPTWNAVIMPLAPPTGDAATYASTNFKYGGITSAYDFTDPTNAADGITYTLNISADPYYRYLEVAYLFGQIQNAILKQPITSSALATQEQELSAAAWSLFVDADPGHVAQLATAINNSGFAVDVAKYLSDAATAAGTPAAPNYSIGHGWYVVKPVQGGFYPMQEFLMKPSSNDFDPVPEPASILLLGVVLVGCGRGLARRWS